MIILGVFYCESYTSNIQDYKIQLSLGGLTAPSTKDKIFMTFLYEHIEGNTRTYANIRHTKMVNSES